MIKGVGEVVQQFCVTLDSLCGTHLVSGLQKLNRHAALQCVGASSRSSLGLRILLRVWQLYRDQLIPQLQFTVRAAKQYRVLATAASTAAGAALGSACSRMGSREGACAGSGTGAGTGMPSSLAGVPTTAGGLGVPLVALGREMTLARLKCANPLCDKQGAVSSATRLQRCGGCKIAAYCG